MRVEREGRAPSARKVSSRLAPCRPIDIAAWCGGQQGRLFMRVGPGMGWVWECKHGAPWAP